MRRLLTKIRVERCDWTSSSRRGWIADQIDVRDAGCDAGPLGISPVSPIRAMSSTGTSIRSSSSFRCDVSTTVTGRYSGVPVCAANSSWIVSSASAVGRAFLPETVLPLFFTAPPRKRAASSSGRCVADKPMRCSGRFTSASSRSSDSARCAPRFVGTSAWISSMMTVSIARSASRAFDVSSR